jgi:hypothetical protein
MGLQLKSVKVTLPARVGMGIEALMVISKSKKIPFIIKYNPKYDHFTLEIFGMKELGKGMDGLLEVIKEKAEFYIRASSNTDLKID